MEFLPHTTGTNKLTATYETVKTHIEQYVQKTYKHGQDIAESLRELKKKDLSGVKPVRQMSTYVKVDEERVRKIEQEGYDVLYTAEVQNYMDRKNTLETNLGRAYALILSTYCNGMMQYRIEEHPEFDSKIQNDPIELLKAIKIVMHDPIRVKYPLRITNRSIDENIEHQAAGAGESYRLHEEVQAIQRRAEVTYRWRHSQQIRREST